MMLRGVAHLPNQQLLQRAAVYGIGNVRDESKVCPLPTFRGIACKPDSDMADFFAGQGFPYNSLAS